MPNPYKDFLRDIFELSACLYNMLLSGKTMDMQLLIHTMDMINGYYRKIVNTNVDDIVIDLDKNILSKIEIL